MPDRDPLLAELERRMLEELEAVAPPTRSEPVTPAAAPDVDSALADVRRLLDELASHTDREDAPDDVHDASRDDAFEPETSDPPAGVRIRIDCVPAINYAVVRAGVPAVRRLALLNHTDTLLESLALSITLRCDALDDVVATSTWSIDALAPGQSLNFTEVKLALDPGVVAQIDEASRAVLQVTLSHDGEVISTISASTRLLAHNEFFNDSKMAELLAAHVLPNHPAVLPVLHAAGAILKRETGDSSLQGYQIGADRARLIGKAIYEALRDLGIGYINPPASFEMTGQKVRTPDQVIEERFGTCLDVACTYAACLEQAGLRPVLMLITGHAYAGFLSEDSSLRQAATRDANLAVTLQDAGLLLPIETVAYTSGSALSFDDALETGRQRLLDASAFVALVDVYKCRREGIHPLPARVMRDGALTVIVHESITPQVIEEPERPPLAAVGRAASIDRTPPRMKHWKAGLLDLSLRNPLLQLKIGRQALEVLVPSGGLGVLEDLLMQGDAVQLAAHDGLTEFQRAKGARTAADADTSVRLQLLRGERLIHVNCDEDDLRRRCKSLIEKARLSEEENGTNILHLALGSVHWLDPKTEKAVRSPLLLLPVRLRTVGRGKPMEMIADPTGSTVHNFCLLHKLRTSFNLVIPELELLEADASGVDVAKALIGIRRAIAAQGLRMRVDEDATLALFQFGKFRMWKDLDNHWEHFLQNPVVRHLVEKAGETFQDPISPPPLSELDQQEVFCPIPADGAQLEAVVAAGAGASFVLEGPPGTGKSQTITNLVANALASGKRVLFVAEKRAALNVVKARLASVGLGPFCLDIHGKGSTPKGLREQLNASLERQSSADIPKWEASRHQFQQRRLHLQKYVAALHEPGPVGLSAWSARQRLLDLGPGPEIHLDATATVASDAIERAHRALEELPAIVRAAGALSGHPWGLVRDADSAMRVDASGLKAAIADLRTALEPVVAGAPTIQRAIISAPDITGLRSFRELLLSIDPLIPRVAREVVRQLREHGTLKSGERALAECRTLLTAANPVRRVFNDSIFSAPLSTLCSGLTEANDSFVLFRRGKVARALEPLQSHLKGDAPESPGRLLELLRVAEQMAAAADGLSQSMRRELGGMLPNGWSLWAENAIEEVRHVAEAVDVIGRVNRHVPEADPAEWAELAGRAAPPADVLLHIIDAWERLVAILCIGTEQQQVWASGRSVMEMIRTHHASWAADAQANFLGLRRWCAVLRHLDTVDAAGFPQLRRALVNGDMLPADASRALARGLARSALTERLAHPLLVSFDGIEHGRAVETFIAARDRDAQLLQEVVPAKLLQARPFKHGERYGEVAELARNELARQRGGMGIRALLKRYSRAIAELTPCFLMSPDSVAQFLEPGAIPFDIVVFDEASQVPVADAIGAIGRGKSLVIVGDSRQMPPTAFFGGGADEDAPEDSALTATTEDLESILSECVGSGVTRLWLSWHYRSQEESLIAFSNAHYYEGRLSSFPAPSQASTGCGVRWHRIAGIFDRGKTRTNAAEAHAVVSEVIRRLDDPLLRQSSMGVVTLNAEQQALVTAMLESHAAEHAALDALLRSEDPERRLFVKNLENVQGDERDVIFLSVGFGRDASGMLSMNFGPLNRAGGERRWNVAVTRAKREVVVFSSIDPEDIDLERIGVGGIGVRHLRAYLALARDGVRSIGEIVSASASQRDFHRDEIATALRAAGLHVTTDLGLSSFRIDIALALPDAPEVQLVAVLLDGLGYAQRRTVQDRDGLPAGVLQHLMRWPTTLRIWMPEWVAERERVIAEAVVLVRDTAQRMQETLRASESRSIEAAPAASAPAASAPGRTSGSSATSDMVPPPTGVDPTPRGANARPSVEQELQDALAALLLPSEPPAPVVAGPASTRNAGSTGVFTPYPVRLGDLGDTDRFEAAVQSNRGALMAVVEQVAAAEGPVQVERLARIIARRYGLARVRAERIRQVIEVIPPARIRRGPFGDFIWPLHADAAGWRDFRKTPPECERALEEIPPEELRNAAVFFAQRGISISESAMLDELAAVFGIQRMTSAVKDRLLAVLAWAVESGALQVADQRYTAR